MQTPQDDMWGHWFPFVQHNPVLGDKKSWRDRSELLRRLERDGIIVAKGMCVCVCVCMYVFMCLSLYLSSSALLAAACMHAALPSPLTSQSARIYQYIHTYTHTHIYIGILDARECAELAEDMGGWLKRQGIDCNDNKTWTRYNADHLHMSKTILGMMNTGPTCFSRCVLCIVCVCTCVYVFNYGWVGGWTSI
jgi:hypothetical protein